MRKFGKVTELKLFFFACLYLLAPYAIAQEIPQQQPTVQAEPTQQQPLNVVQPSTFDSQMPIRPASKMLQGGAERDTTMQAPPVEGGTMFPTYQRMQSNSQQAPSMNYQQPPQMNYQQPQMAPPYRAPMPMYAQQNSPMFLQAQVDSRGTPTLPAWKTQPEEIIGHFHIDFMGISIKQVNGPTSNRIEFSKDEKWRGARHRPCFIWLTQVRDGSGGYYFHCMENHFGPSGWIYPIAKRGPEDKVTPWAIFFNQP